MYKKNLILVLAGSRGGENGSGGNGRDVVESLVKYRRRGDHIYRESKTSQSTIR